MAENKKLSRRKFIVRSLIGGTGVVLGSAYIGRNALRRSIYPMLDDPNNLVYIGDTSKPLMWFEINDQNQITLHSPKVEMGQGTFTGMAQLAADELEVNIDQIRVVHAASATGNIDGMSTGGSTSIAGFWQPLRELAATMREMLTIEGAKQLGADRSTVTVQAGKVSADGKSLTYGEIVAGVTEWDIPETPALKPIEEYKYIGKPIDRVDLEAKVYGDPIFGMDAAIPGMLYGSVVRPPKIGAKFKDADISEAESMPGVVKIVKEADFVGVVANSFIEAENAKSRIQVTWETERDWNTEDIEEMIRVGSGKAMTIQKEGDTFEASEGDSGYFEMEFKSPIGAHAQLEPNGAVADVTDEAATIHISTQVVKMTRSEVAERLGLDEENVNIVPTYLGGGFGRRLHTPNAVQAAVLSKAVGKPVKCFFNRKEEFQHDTFRPPTHHIMRAKLDEGGKINGIEHSFSSGHVMFGSALLPPIAGTILGADAGAIRGGFLQYKNIPNIRAISWVTELPFATSWWRSLGLLANTFAIESFMDQLALDQGKDPIQFRLDHIQDDEAGDRLRAVIERAKDKANYKDEASGNRAMGFACSTDAGTPCAQVVEVAVVNGKIKVEKVVCVIDPGLAVNPDQVRAQCEGCINMGISAAMFERMYVNNSQLWPTIYGPYEMALMRHAPKEIDVEIINGTGKPGAVGEPPLGPIGAAIGNAVYRITGKRLTELPLQKNLEALV